MDNTTKIVLLAGVAAAVGAVVQVYLTNKLQDTDASSTDIQPSSPQVRNTGSEWSNPGTINALQPSPQMANYNGPGSENAKSNFNGAIWVRRFGKGGNPNAGRNGSRENSWAFQTATKNPHANGTNCTYARAVATATQDPTNQVTSLVLGAQIAPNNPAA